MYVSSVRVSSQSLHKSGGGPRPARLLLDCEVGMMKALLTAAILIAVAALAVGLLPGCGGGSNAGHELSAGKAGGVGTVAVTVRFPPQDAEVQTSSLPRATNSVRFLVLDPTRLEEVVPSVLVRRSPGDSIVRARLRDVPAGEVIVQALAFATTDGEGTLIAEAEAFVSVVAGRTSSLWMVAGRLPVEFVINGPAQLERGAQQTYSATAYDADGEIAVGVTFRDWASGDPAILSVDGSGLVTANMPGTTELTIVAAYANATWPALLTVEVFDRQPVTVEVTPATMALALDEKRPVQAQAFDGDGNPIPYAEISWHSTDEAVATVTPPSPPPPPPSLNASPDAAEAGVSGAVVMGIGVGSAQVIASAQTAAGSAEGACQVVVAAPE